MTDITGSSGMNYLQLTQTLSESFNALADEVQSLIDRKTILEHKLRYAHEQYQYLADKYAPAVPEVSETLAKLQLPPDLHSPHLTTATSLVPLPRRGQPGTGHHQIALLIREGRKAAQQLAPAGNMGDVMVREGGSSKETSASPDDHSAVTMTSMSTALEKDFTVPGKKSLLACPFSPSNQSVDNPTERAAAAVAEDVHDLTGTTVEGLASSPHHSGASDPICAAMLEEENPSAPTAPATGAAATKCPIRFLDKHSPEEVAHYVETHKHEIPRSHEICVRRYQRNEEQIRKLDAKYGNLASMINDLSQLHKPMLPSAAAAAEPGEDPEDVDRASNKRVENWARAVSSGISDPEEVPPELPVDEERESHFDRPLRDVRLGESPSRPWGIPVPAGVRHVDGLGEETDLPPVSPSPAPVRMHSPLRPPPPAAAQQSNPQEAGSPRRKCPFDHTKLPFPSFSKPEDEIQSSHGATAPKHEHINDESGSTQHVHFTDTPYKKGPKPHGRESSPPLFSPAPAPQQQPTFISPGVPPLPIPIPSAETKTTAIPHAHTPAAHAPLPPAPPPPQMVFNISGPVFIGYPMEQAMQFMQRFQQGQGQGQ